MRCLTLADGLREAGANASFACRTLPGNLSDLIRTRGYAVQEMSATARAWQADAAETAAILNGKTFNGLVVDHYALDVRWESVLRRYVNGIMAIDDLADRPHDCDILLDQNYYDAMAQRYNDCLPVNCLKLLGPRYALLRREFREVRQRLRSRDGSVKNILIFFGGADPQNITAKAIAALAKAGRSDITADVVIGATNPHRRMIEVLCAPQRNLRLHVQADNMAQLMAAADLGIGAGGATMWERCLLGLPTLTVVFAHNQERSTRETGNIGALRYLGWADKLTVDALAADIDDAIRHPKKLMAMSQRAIQIMDGFSTTGQPLAVSALLERFSDRKTDRLRQSPQ